MNLSGDLNRVGVIFSSNADVFSVLDTLERLVVWHKPLLGVWNGQSEHSYMVSAVAWQAVQQCVPVHDQESFMLIWNHPLWQTCCRFVNTGDNMLFKDKRHFLGDDLQFVHCLGRVAKTTPQRNCTIDPVTNKVYVASTPSNWPNNWLHQDVLTPLWETMRLERKVKNKWK